MDTYERKYNEAVLRADEAVQNGCLDKDIFDIIFPPEESEDERMIKWIIKVLDEGYKAFFEMDYSKEDVLSWLKKQKEQKPIQTDAEKEYVRTLKRLVADL